MNRVEGSIDIDVPVGTAYNQWTQFEEFPRFMEGVKKVRQMDPSHLHWRIQIGGEELESTVQITRQIPDHMIGWRSTSGTKNAGEIWFQFLSPFKTHVTLYIDYEPGDLLENIGDVTGVVSKRVADDLLGFKEFTEERGTATGAWRGEIKNGQIREPVITDWSPVVGAATETKIVAIGVDCPVCGMPRHQWLNKGTLHAGAAYCCEGCATGTGCICQSERQAAA